MSRLPTSLGRWVLYRAGQGGRYWTGDCNQRTPVMTVHLTDAQVFASPAAAYEAARRVAGLQCAKPVRL